ncbi:MAG: 5-methyltetrahydropteroyltriglutamate--homocysteine S-methyltransferase [Proteobacteria bacterium]|uniref:5-methyltetrahydropteroyltriglutamate--homocysteine S-methyltransferase n=1 Tax=Candidatus Avisuccinivibrio stercorigallinarum TaxID=2840704 RepID=A0A9D9DCC2_9GAMM|nr:5-methyltetrahydropteroyltriglutamate--homocysteine S-methyltransferase [Candidatus Avisuccinivibrio stercorigallinarum]
MAHIKPPFRADHVGSFLRPAAIVSARALYAKNLISREELTAVEDKEIAALIQAQKAHGLKAVTDGEFRRAFWHLDFLAALDGIEHIKAEAWSVKFKDANPKAETIRIISKVDFSESHPFVEHFERLQKLAGETMVKFTIPSPSMLHLICCVRPENYEPIERYAGKDEELCADIAAAYVKCVKALYARGCRYLQLDDTSWGEFCSAEKREKYQARGIDLERIADLYISMINTIMAAKPEDMTICMHICRGNFRSTWFSSGGYAPVAEKLFGGCHIDGFFLEYDSDRAGDFKPLAHIKDQTVVLGLITSKTPELEPEAAIKERIAEASQYVPLEHLCLSTQCGFASTEEGNNLTAEQQWAKIDLVVKIASEIWTDC